MAETFRDLKVQYGLTLQLRRAVVSVAANIVEGWKRRTDKDNAHVLNIAEGSLEESKYLFILSHDVGYLTASDYPRASDLCDEIGRMLNGLSRSLRP